MNIFKKQISKELEKDFPNCDNIIHLCQQIKTIIDTDKSELYQDSGLIDIFEKQEEKVIVKKITEKVDENDSFWD